MNPDWFHARQAELRREAWWHTFWHLLLNFALPTSVSLGFLWVIGMGLKGLL